SAAAAQVTVTGKVFYEDRTYTGSGFTGLLVNRPVRQAEIELPAAGHTGLANGVTNDTGDYSLSFAGPHQNASIRIFTRRTDGTGKINAVVLDNQGGGQVYAVVGPVFNTSPSPGDLVITKDGGAGGPFNIFDCAVKSFQLLAGIEPSFRDAGANVVFLCP